MAANFFFSKKMKAAETKYSTFDRELLAVYLAIRHFRHFLEGRQFHVLTDHKPLTFALQKRSDRHSPRQARQLDFISQFTLTIRHIHGPDNVVADTLSRIEMNALLSNQPPVIDFTAMAKAQALDPQIRSLQSAPASPLVVEGIPLPNATEPLLCDISTGSQRPLVPQQWRRTVFDSLHNLSHPGIRATQKLITSRFVWPGIQADVRRWTRCCTQCQKVKVHQHSSAGLSQFRPPDARLIAFTLILSVRCHRQEDIHTYSHALIDTQGGRKQYPCPLLQQRLWHMPSYTHGSHVLESHQRLLQIVVASLSQNSGSIS